MIKVIKLHLDREFKYYEGNTTHLNPSNIESVELDVSNEDIIYIRMVSGEEITTSRAALNRIIERVRG